MGKIKGFTLAETLTTLIIIGVIAVIVLPSLKGGVDEKTLDSQQKVFKQKLNDGFHRMQIKGALKTDYKSTEDFVEVMRKHFNITKVCQKDKLKDCFGPKIRQSKSSVKYNLDDIRTSDQLDIRFSKPSNVVGLVFSDGVRALIAYNTDECVVSNQWDTSIDVTDCLAMYYDVSGEDGATILGEDVITLNVGDKAIDIGEVYTATNKFDINQCEKAKAEGAPIVACPRNTDYYAYAKWFCHQKGKHLPSRAEMASILKDVYGQPISATGASSGLQVVDKNGDLWNKLGNSAFWTSDHEIANDDWSWPYWVKIQEDYVLVYRGWSAYEGEEGVYGSVDNSTLKFFCIK